MDSNKLLILAAAGAGIYLWTQMPAKKEGPALPPRIIDIQAPPPPGSAVIGLRIDPPMLPMPKPPLLAREGRNYLKGPIFFNAPY
jgi:hypothetical protein